MNTEPSLKDKVRKIESARKVQKEKIESNQLNKLIQSEDIERMQKPVVTALEPLAQIPGEVQALQQQQQTAQQKQLNVLQTLLGKALELQQPKDFSDDEEPESESESESPPEQHYWVQNLFSTYRSNESRLSKCEVSSKGNIGEIGKMSLPKLFNNNEIELSVDGRVLYRVEPKDMTPGIAALVLLPWNDIEQSNIEITNLDKNIYYNIMNYAGMKASKGVKYQNILKPIQDQEDSLEEPHQAEAMDIDSTFVNPLHKSTPQVKRGKGVFVYNNPQELENRIGLVIGSIRAGNTSIELRKELRSLLDEMLEKGYMGLNIHEKYYSKFKLV